MLVRIWTKGNFGRHWWEYKRVVTVEVGVAVSRKEKNNRVSSIVNVSHCINELIFYYKDPPASLSPSPSLFLPLNPILPSFHLSPSLFLSPYFLPSFLSLLLFLIHLPILSVSLSVYVCVCMSPPIHFLFICLLFMSFLAIVRID